MQIYVANVRDVLDSRQLQDTYQTMGDHHKAVSALLDPAIQDSIEKETKKKVRNTNENKVAYLEALNSMGKFKSVQDIIDSVIKLNHIIEK